MGLLCSRSRSQQRFKMSVNVSVDDIFWIADHLVTKFGMVMQHHEPMCHAEIFVVAVATFKVKVTVRAHMIKTLSIFFELLIPWQPNLVWWYIIRSQNVLWKKVGLLRSGSRSQGRVKMLMFVQMISSKPPSMLFPTALMLPQVADLSQSTNKLGIVMHRYARAHRSKITMSTVSFELLILLLPNLVW